MVQSCHILRSPLHSFNGTVEPDCDFSIFLLFCGPGGIEGHVEQHRAQV